VYARSVVELYLPTRHCRSLGRRGLVTLLDVLNLPRYCLRCIRLEHATAHFIVLILLFNVGDRENGVKTLAYACRDTNQALVLQLWEGSMLTSLYYLLSNSYYLYDSSCRTTP
jgi:hypothetical protein